MTHLSDLEVSVIDFNRFSGKAQVRQATLTCDSSYCLFSLGMQVCIVIPINQYDHHNIKLTIGRKIDLSIETKA